jgi:DNA-binding IclR family transcriptional regulator
LLAYGPQNVVDRLIEEGLHAYTDRTIVSPQKLLTNLEEVCRQGFSISDQELEIGLFAVGAPIWDSDGKVTAAISVSGPPERMSKESLPRFTASVQESARQISVALGWKEPDDHVT